MPRGWASPWKSSESVRAPPYPWPATATRRSLPGPQHFWYRTRHLTSRVQLCKWMAERFGILLSRHATEWTQTASPRLPGLPDRGPLVNGGDLRSDGSLVFSNRRKLDAWRLARSRPTARNG